jgi:hypothetical protein
VSASGICNQLPDDNTLAEPVEQTRGRQVACSDAPQVVALRTGHDAIDIRIVRGAVDNDLLIGEAEFILRGLDLRMALYRKGLGLLQRESGRRILSIRSNCRKRDEYEGPIEFREHVGSFCRRPAGKRPGR